MSNRIGRLAWIAAGLAVSWAVSCSNGPAEVRKTELGTGGSGGSTGGGIPMVTGGSSGAGGAGGSTGGSGGSGIAGGPIIVMTDGGQQPDACDPLTCTPEGGQYCGKVGDGCLGTMECPDCMGDWVCDEGLCKGGPSCMARTSCAAGDTSYCGVIGDDCGA
jgi:hypothetical protein